MAERRMAEVVGEGQCFGQILVEPERTGDRAADLGNLEAVGKSGAEEVTLVVDEYLSLILQLAESRAVDDAVAVALPRRSRRTFRFRVKPPTRSDRADRPGCQAAHPQLHLAPGFARIQPWPRRPDGSFDVPTSSPMPSTPR